MNIVRVNFDRADPPAEVIDSFRDVQAAEQTRDTLEKQADAYANQVIAAARGEAAQLLEEAEGYRARVVNEAEGEAQRFIAVYDEYAKAEDVTRKRLYLETMERVFARRRQDHHRRRRRPARAWCPTCRSTSCSGPHRHAGATTTTSGGLN